MLHLITNKETSTRLIYELGFIFGYYEFRNPEVGENIFPNEFLSLSSHYDGQRLHFYPLSKAVDCYYEVLHLCRDEWKRT